MLEKIHLSLILNSTHTDTHTDTDTHTHTHTHTHRHTKHTHKQSTIQPNYNKIRLCGTFDPQYTFKYIEEN